MFSSSVMRGFPLGEATEVAGAIIGRRWADGPPPTAGGDGWLQARQHAAGMARAQGEGKREVMAELRLPPLASMARERSLVMSSSQTTGEAHHLANLEQSVAEIQHLKITISFEYFPGFGISRACETVDCRGFRAAIPEAANHRDCAGVAEEGERRCLLCLTRS
jgi:hypothetical protein